MLNNVCLLRRLDGINHLVNKSYRDERGWSKDMVGGDGTVVIKLGDGTELSAHGGESHGPFSIEMRKQGGEPSTVFSLDIGSGLVSRSEYQHAFHGPE